MVFIKFYERQVFRLFKVINRLRQRIPVSIVEDGVKKRELLFSKDACFSEEVTRNMLRLEKRRIIKIREVDDED